MNERIKEFEDQASQYASRETTDLDEWEFIFRKKFAELIVRKCIKDCRDMFVVDSVSWNLLNEKLEHFGVEE